MAKTIEQIQEEVQQIKNETVAKQNTATRVGGALEDMVEKMEADSISVEGKLTNLGSKVGELESSAGTYARKSQTYAQTEESMFAVTDTNGNIAMQVDAEGKLDAIAIGDNLKSQMTDMSQKVAEVVSDSRTPRTTENMFAVTDTNGNIAMQVDAEGKLDAIAIGDNLTNIIKSFSEGIGASDVAGLTNLMSWRKAYDKSLADSTASHDVATIPLKKSGKQRLLIALHKRENDGYESINSAWLPNANKDFSDVVVTANGKPLNYMTVYNGNVDVLIDKKLGSNMNDSTIGWYNNVGYIVYQSKICYTEDDFKTKIPLPVFSDLMPCRLIRVLSNGTMFVTCNYKMYRSAYPYTSKQMIYDMSQYQESTPNKELISEFHGAIYMGHYQESPRRIKIDKSTDDGLTWTQIYYTEGEDSYQHIHTMYVDEINDILFVCCDDGDARHGGGGILWTKDGETWGDWRADNPNIPHSTDQGVIYSSEGKWLVGGETSVSGGFTVQKTTDGYNFTPVLGEGKSCYWMRKKNGVVISSMLSGDICRDSQIMLSKDDGETWETIFTTAYLPNSHGTSDGFRKYCIVGDDIVSIFQQGGDAFGARIKVGGDNYFSQIIVDVPEDVDEIKVESGMYYPNYTVLHNEFSKDGIVSIHGKHGQKEVRINGNTTYYDQLLGEPLRDSFGGIMNTPFNGITSFDFGEGITIDGAIVPRNFHIGFKLKLYKNFKVNTITLIEDAVNKIILWNGKLIRINGKNKGYHRVDVRDSWLFFDINFRDGVVETYVNGINLHNEREMDTTYDQASVTFSGSCTLCKCTEDIYKIADFELTECLSETEILEKKYGLLTDNMN